MLDAGEHELRELERREFTLAEKFPDLFDWGERQIGFVRAQNILS